MCEPSNFNQALVYICATYVFWATVITVIGCVSLADPTKYSRKTLFFSTLIISLFSVFIWQVMLLALLNQSFRATLTKRG